MKKRRDTRPDPPPIQQPGSYRVAPPRPLEEEEMPPKKPFWTDMKKGACCWLSVIAIAYVWAALADAGVFTESHHVGIWVVTGVLVGLIVIALLLVGGFAMFNGK